MISENHSDITFNAWVLKGCLASLGVAVLCVAVAVVI